MSGFETDCTGVFARLSEYLDGELSPEVCEKMKAHIEDCAPCVEFVNSLQKTVSLTKSPAIKDAAPSPITEECRNALLEAYTKAKTGQ